jgi:hypothetical protein
MTNAAPRKQERDTREVNSEITKTVTMYYGDRKDWGTKIYFDDEGNKMFKRVLGKSNYIRVVNVSADCPLTSHQVAYNYGATVLDPDDLKPRPYVENYRPQPTKKEVNETKNKKRSYSSNKASTKKSYSKKGTSSRGRLYKKTPKS